MILQYGKCLIGQQALVYQVRKGGAAQLFQRDLLGQEFVHEGILGTTFTGKLIRETKLGDYDAVVPTISGTAWITGFAQYVVDPEDPFPNGFTVGDIWGGEG